MKLPRQTERTIVWDTLMRHSGDRKKTAVELGVSERTLSRYITALDLHEDMDRMGWKAHRGPPPGVSKGSSIVRIRLIDYIKRNRGEIDYTKLVKEIYGQDTPSTRYKLYAAMEEVQKQGVVVYDGQRWRVLDKAV